MAIADKDIKKINLPVEGMTCFSCTMHVEGSLQDLDGVRNVKASVSDKSVAISYDPAKIDVVQLVAASGVSLFESGKSHLRFELG